MNELSYLFDEIEKFPPTTVITAGLLTDLITFARKKMDDDQEQIDSIQMPH